MLSTIESAPAPPIEVGLPRYFIEVNERRVYALEDAPIEVFDAWVQGIVKAEQIDDSLALWLIKKHAESWDNLARHWFVVNLGLRGIDISKHAYASEEAARA